MNRIIPAKEILVKSKLLGSKTLNLKRCLDLGFNVPKFIALPSNLSSGLFKSQTLRKAVTSEISTFLQSNRYAVRSSALIEDSQSQSYAGQFLTKINLEENELEEGIYQVLAQAQEFLNNDLAKFSIIVQEYIEAKVSGVTFTRNPTCGREMVIEYGFEKGEKIVGGAVRPKKTAFYWLDQSAQKLPKELLDNQIIKKFQELEFKFGFPQDIEWCLKDQHFYLLQTRPVTTISKDQYEEIQYLESRLKKEKYFYEKTELAEIAPRPSKITEDLLKLIYKDQGPVFRVYKKYGINYQSRDFLKIIGNELYVDKEEEIQGLLPAYSYLGNKHFQAKISWSPKLFRTIKNILFLSKIKTQDYEKIFSQLKTKIEKDQRNNQPDLEGVINNFLSDYELIFETNLLSGIAIKRLEHWLKNEPITFPEVILGSSSFIDLGTYHINPPQNLKGNSLEISDESVFRFSKAISAKDSSKINKWWPNVPEYKKKLLKKLIIEAIIYNQLREFGRYLTVVNLNRLRESILAIALKRGFKNTRNIYFSNLVDIINEASNEKDCGKVKENYEKYNRYHLPNRLTSSLIIENKETLGVSAGIAQGCLKTREMLTEKDKNIILYSEILAPNLTQYFDQVIGIAAENGGMLSHLAIMAREKNLPVVVGLSLRNSEIKIGDQVEINGSSGEVKKI